MVSFLRLSKYRAFTILSQLLYYDYVHVCSPRYVLVEDYVVLLSNVQKLQLYCYITLHPRQNRRTRHSSGSDVAGLSPPIACPKGLSGHCML